jgi:hypothetical protein
MKYDFDAITAYKNKHVVDRYMEDTGVKDRQYAEQVFQELKKFLVACSSSVEPCSPSKSVDPMWHTFLMFSKDYMIFCEKYLGRYIHHQPEKDQTRNKAGYKAAKLEIGSLFGEVDSDVWGSSEYDQCGGFPEECDNGCCHNPCGSEVDLEFFPRILADRGTVININLKDVIGNVVKRNVFNSGIGGILYRGTDLGAAFEKRYLRGYDSNGVGDFAFAKMNGRCTDCDVSQIETKITEVSFDILYPDGTAKTSQFRELAPDTGVIWGDALVNRLSSKERFSDRWESNPAVFFIDRTGVTARACSSEQGTKC